MYLLSRNRVIKVRQRTVRWRGVDPRCKVVEKHVPRVFRGNGRAEALPVGCIERCQC